jgi:uncharacterized protein YcbX
MNAPEGAGPVVTDLFIYPIKACAGIRVLGAAVGPAGFVDDRRWMIVDETGKFVTQRTLPQLCRVLVSIVDFSYRVTVEGQDSFFIPRRPASGRPVTVQVWKDNVEAWEHEEFSAFLSDTLGGRYRGVFVPDDALRQVNPARAQAGDRVGFADGYPFLMLSRESLDELNRRLTERGEQPLDVRRFRPNIVVAGCAHPHQEDDYRTLRIGKLGFRMPKACDRCVVTTVDPDTGTTGREPLRTLASYRRWDNAVWFGVNLIHDGQGSLRVGDSVELHERIEPRA